MKRLLVAAAVSVALLSACCGHHSRMHGNCAKCCCQKAQAPCPSTPDCPCPKMPGGEKAPQ